MATSSKTKPRTLSTRQRDRMPTEKFAFPKQRKEPLNDAGHVRSAIARFDQVEGVTATERAAAWRRIRAAAARFGVEVQARRRTSGGRAGGK